MHELLQELKGIFRGDIDTSQKTLEMYSHDASLFEVMPQAVVYPRDAKDIGVLVQFVHKHKLSHPDLSLTVRAAGTCMSGGPLNDSIIIDVTRYMNRIIQVTDDYVIVEPGCYFRDLEKEIDKRNRFFPPYTASKELCALGGMYGNNCAGEKTLRYGKFESYILESKVVFSDGHEYRVGPLSENERVRKMSLDTLEGNIYTAMTDMVLQNFDALQTAKPKVTKNSAGYALWNVWDEHSDTFDLNKLLVGSQGTLGIVTQMKLRILPKESESGMLVTFLPELSHLGEVTKVLASHTPVSIESFDDYSLKLAMKFFFDFFKQLGFFRALGLGFRFIPELILIIVRGMPKLVLIAEVTGSTKNEVQESLYAMRDDIARFGYKTRLVSGKGADKYWRIRRESFNLLRKHVKGRKTAPFIDDVIVPVESLAQFLPNLTRILNREKVIYTIAGHAGNGNFHVIPLMDLKQSGIKEKIMKITDEVYSLVLLLGGSLTAEHGDGIMRSPYLPQMFDEKTVQFFNTVKEIFDPLKILNPHKKVGVSREYLVSHIKNE